MKRTVLFCFVLAFLTVPITAQDFGVVEEVTAGNFCGFGARQMAMGGAGIANSLDGAAMYYNPAALTRIPRIEFQVEVTRQKFTNETRMPTGRYDPAAFASTLSSAETDASKSRLSAIRLTVPIPTYRGAMVVAGGVNRVMSFDRVALFHVRDVRTADGAVVEDIARERENGSIYLYTAAAGMDLSPHLSVGLALNVYSGTDKFLYEWSHIDETNDDAGGSTSIFEDDYFAAAIKAGLLVRPNDRLTFGATIESPVKWEVQQAEIDESDRDVVKYNLTRPFAFAGGVAWRVNTLRITGEAEYIDWSKMKYGDNADMEPYTDSLAQAYRAVVTLRAGAEWQFPRSGLAVRAGVFSQPLPYDDRFITDDRMGFSFGVGWLPYKALQVEAAYVRAGFTRTYTAPNADITVAGNDMATAEDGFQRLYLTVSYRY